MHDVPKILTFLLYVQIKSKVDISIERWHIYANVFMQLLIV